MFNGVASVSVGGGTILANGKPPGTVHAVEWTTATPVTARSLNLFLAHDGRGVSDPSFKLRDARARGITKFELLADTGSGFQHVLTADVEMTDGGDTGPQPPGEPVCPSAACFDLYDPVYGGATLNVDRAASFVTLNTVAGYLTIAADFPATTADTWRAELTQFGNFLDLYSDTGGSRILELDGLADPQLGVWGAAYEALFADLAEVEAFRSYRDEMVTQDESARLYTRVLYRHSEDALDVLLANPELMRQASRLIAANTDAVQRALAGEHAVIHNTDEIAAFLGSYAEKSPTVLKLWIRLARWQALAHRQRGEPFLGFRLR
jgi:hypothetical protein